jgi:hypothetical protein
MCNQRAIRNLCRDWEGTGCDNADFSAKAELSANVHLISCKTNDLCLYASACGIGLFSTFS